MDETKLRELIRKEFTKVVSEGGTNTLRRSFDVFEIAVDELWKLSKYRLDKDRTLAKISNEFAKLLKKVENHLYNNYKGWDHLNEATDWDLDDARMRDSMRVLRGVFYGLEDGNDYGLKNLVKNTRNDKELKKFWKASVVLTKKLEKHLHKEYPDWEKRNG
jgi:hypothetical protein